MIMHQVIDLFKFLGESSTFNASMMTFVDPGIAAAGVSLPTSVAVSRVEIDPTKPNDHPVLKVCARNTV